MADKSMADWYLRQGFCETYCDSTNTEFCLHRAYVGWAVHSSESKKQEINVYPWRVDLFVWNRISLWFKMYQMWNARFFTITIVECNTTKFDVIVTKISVFMCLVCYLLL